MSDENWLDAIGTEWVQELPEPPLDVAAWLDELSSDTFRDCSNSDLGIQPAQTLQL